MHPSKLIYRFRGLDKDRNYLVSIVYPRLPSDTTKRSISAEVDGMALHSALTPSASPKPHVFKLPKQAYQDGEVVLNLNRVKGPNVAVSRIALWLLPKGKGGPQTSELSPAPRVTGLDLAYPNPTSEGAEIHYSLKGSGRVSLALFDVSGRLVRQLVDEVKEAGTFRLAWDGGDASGQKASSGVYFIRLRAGSFESTRRLVVTR